MMDRSTTAERKAAAGKPAAHIIDLKKVIARALKRYAVRTAFTAIFIVLSVILEVIPPLVLGDAVDELTDNKMISLTMGITYFALLACSGLSSAIREALIVASGESITHALRTEMIDKLHRLPASYFTGHEAGTISAIQVNDVDAIEDMFSSGLISMFTDLGTVVAVLVAVFTKSVGLGLLLLIALPPLAAFTRHVQKKMLTAHTENRKATADASGILPETLHIIRSLHVYRAENFAEKRYDAAIQKSFRAIERTNFYDAIYSPVIMTASAAVIGIMMSLSGQSGAFRAWFGMSVGTAVAVIAYVGKVFTPLSSIGMEIQTVQSAAAGWKRVQGFLDEKEISEPGARFGRYSEAAAPLDAPDPEKAVSRAVSSTTPANSAENAIEIRDLSFSYDKAQPVLKGFSLDVKKGSFVTLMGRTGAGKSTLFKLLLGLYPPDKGTIRIGGVSPTALGEAERRKIICCVEQKVTPVPGTIRSQVTLGNPSFEDAEIWTALDTVGLKGTVSALPEMLDTPYRDAIFSQGQKQLLMIARAIVSDPEILLLDEITAGLDSSTEEMIVKALENASANRTVVSISHRLSEILPGRIIRM